MSIPDPSVGESFTFRVRKSIISQPSIKWWNTYEARLLGEGSSEDLELLATSLSVFEATALLNTYQVDIVTMSTWAEDSHPYNPMSFATMTFNSPGERPIGIGRPAALRMCFYIKRQMEFGRLGKIFLRGSLLVGDLSTIGGEWALEDPGTFNGILDDMMSASEIAQFLESGASLLKLSLIGANGVTREIEDFQVGGVVDVKTNHKYFDVA